MKRPRVRFTLRRMMVVVAISAVALWVGMNHWSGWRESIHQWRINRWVWQKLDQPITLKHPEGLPLDQLIAKIQRQAGLKIFLDPEGIQDAGSTTTSVLTIDVESVPLKAALSSSLEPIGLKLHVYDGMACVTAKD